MLRMFSKPKRSHQDIESHPLLSIEKEEITEAHEVNHEELPTTTKLDTLFAELFVKHQQLYRAQQWPSTTAERKISLIKEAQKTKLSEGKKNINRNLICFLILSLSGGAVESGFGYLLYDLISRALKALHVQDLWENSIVERYEGSAFTCAELNGGVPINNSPVSCYDPNPNFNDIAEAICRKFYDEYCSATFPLPIIAESTGAAIALIISLLLLPFWLYFLYQLFTFPCRQTNPDSLTLEQILDEDAYSILKDSSMNNHLSLNNHLNINKKMKSGDVIRAIEDKFKEDVDDIIFIKKCLEMKKYAHYLYQLKHGLENEHSLSLPNEIIALIFLYLNAYGSEFSNYKQSTPFQMDIFGRFFDKPAQVNIDEKDNKIFSSGILDVFRK